MKIVLSQPTPLDERFVNTSSCGQCTVASDATDLHGKPVSDRQVLDVYTGITDAARLVALDTHFGVESTIMDPTMPVFLLAYGALMSGRRARFCHQCNGNAEPVARGTSKIGHWREIYGIDTLSAVLYTYSPWGGVYEQLSFAVAEAADLHQTIGILDVMLKDEPKPTPSPAPPDDEVYPMFLWSGGTRPAGAGADPRGNGAVYLCDGTRAQPGHFKRWFAGVVGSALPEYVAKYGALEPAEGAELFVLDRMIELPAITNDYVVATGFATRPLPTPDPAP